MNNVTPVSKPGELAEIDWTRYQTSGTCVAFLTHGHYWMCLASGQQVDCDWVSAVRLLRPVPAGAIVLGPIDPATGEPWDAAKLRHEASRLVSEGRHCTADRLIAITSAVEAATP